MTEYWMNIISRSSWETEKGAGRFMIGTIDKYEGTVKSLKKGDRVVYYIAGGEGRLCGIFEVVSDYYYDNTPFWKEKVFPHRARLEPILFASTKEQEVDIRPHIGKLGFIRDKKTWGPYFKAHLRRIPKTDFDYLLQRLKEKVEGKPPEEFDRRYVPPIIAELPLLAREEIDKLEDLEGNPQHEFEKRLWLAFRMLGFEVQELGHKAKGSAPDGIAKARKEHFAIIFDAKARKDGYAISAGDERAAKSYLDDLYDGLDQQGMHNVSFVFISSSFRGEYSRKARKIMRDTKAKGVRLLNADFLPLLVGRRWRKSGYNLRYIEDLFFGRGMVTKKEIEALNL